MIGLGLDLCDIARMEAILQKTPSFLERYFSAEERNYLSAKHQMKASSMAGMFAAKEAFLKAMGIGIGAGIQLCDIGITHDTYGAPSYVLTETALALMGQKGAKRAFLSITHENGIAAAVCVLDA